MGILRSLIFSFNFARRKGSALRSAVICFYLSNEGLSLLENAAYIGLPIPDKLREILAQLHNREDKNDQGDAD